MNISRIQCNIDSFPLAPIESYHKAHKVNKSTMEVDWGSVVSGVGYQALLSLNKRLVNYMFPNQKWLHVLYIIQQHIPSVIFLKSTGLLQYQQITTKNTTKVCLLCQPRSSADVSMFQVYASDTQQCQREGFTRIHMQMYVV